MRSVHLFNHDWLYITQATSTDTPDSEFERVTLPHSNRIFPWHNFDDREYQFISTYRKRFTLPEARAGRRIYLDFEGVMTACTVSINGHNFEEHRGGFVPFSYDITDYLIEEGENLLEVSVDSRERADIPPHGGRVDYLVFGGIYRDVNLRYVEPVHITNVRVRTYNVLTDNPRVEVDVWVVNESEDRVSYRMRTLLINEDEPMAEKHVWTSINVSPKASERHTASIKLGDGYSYYELWSIDNPKIYYVHCFICEPEIDNSYPDSEKGMIDELHGLAAFGFRETEFREDGFYLNGEKLFLRGLNRHQMYPFIGMAAPKRLEERDADILKAMGCNIVRTSHYPQSKHFLNRCDEIGLLVFEEIPGWQHIGNEDWQQISLRDVRAMIERDWNHPSIVLWGVRVNESWDNDEFYQATNALARELDPTRQTTGVRFWPHSSFLEDVYGYNDFTNGVLEPMQTPWLITEYNGHMYPTKTFDNEDRQVEHALRHARIQSQAMSTGGVSGAIGWCAFDYNTHREFGSGDRVCYHGVMDMWRQPKWAAYAYRSQKSPDEEIVLEVASFWTVGDRAGGGNDPIYVFTNCEAIDVYVGKQQVGTFTPSGAMFPNLPHPPIKIAGLGLHWGGELSALRVIGLRNGEQVAKRTVEADGVPHKLLCYAEDDKLNADGMDMTRLVFKIVDQYGNRLPYAMQPVQFELLEGDAKLIGENPFALVGGQAALFVKAGCKPGTVCIKASTARLNDVEVTIELV